MVHNVSRGSPMQMVAILEIRTIQMHILLYYCTLLLTCQILAL